MILIDLALFFSLFLFQLIFFFLFHLIVLRIFAKNNILYSSALTILISVSTVTLLSYFLVSGLFSSPETYAVAAAGSAISAIFACGLYTFLGPATADRSLACQLIVFLAGRPGSACRRDEIYSRFDSADFLEKRIEEFGKEHIIEDSIESISLTGRGERIAAIYIFLLRSLGLRERCDYRAYFPND